MAAFNLEAEARAGLSSSVADGAGVAADTLTASLPRLLGALGRLLERMQQQRRCGHAQLGEALHEELQHCAMAWEHLGQGLLQRASMALQQLHPGELAQIASGLAGLVVHSRALVAAAEAATAQPGAAPAPAFDNAYAYDEEDDREQRRPCAPQRDEDVVSALRRHLGSQQLAQLLKQHVKCMAALLSVLPTETRRSLARSYAQLGVQLPREVMQVFARDAVAG